MAAITSNTESWDSHKFSEVETHLKNRFNELEYNGHAYVEIGGLKWATMNIGANSVTDYGQYFQWGDTTGYVAANVGSSGTTDKKQFNWVDYKFSGGRTSPGNTGMTKYNSTDGKTELDKCDDAARANWGGAWRMPTLEECAFLEDYVNTAWTTDYQGSGVAGKICTDKTDSSKVLFFPAAGYCNNGSVSNVGNYGYYWSTSILSDIKVGWRLNLWSFPGPFTSYSNRHYGIPVRAVIG